MDEYVYRDTLHAAAEARFIMFGDTRSVKLEDYVQVSQR